MNDDGIEFTRARGPVWYISRLQRLRATNRANRTNHYSKQFEFTHKCLPPDNVKNIFTIPHIIAMFSNCLNNMKAISTV